MTTEKPIIPPEQILYNLINQMVDAYDKSPLMRLFFEMQYVKEGYKFNWNKRLNENGEWEDKK